MKCREPKKAQPVKAIPQRKYSIIPPNGDDQESSRFHDRLSHISGEWNQVFKGK